jgi:mannose-1-phosphate guanylyltransferase/phosphomannomutase
MITIVNKPTIGHILNLLKENGISEVIITVQYLASIIQDYFGDGANLGMKINYCVEEDPLGTAGGVKNVQSLIDDTFLVISGDAITDFNLREVINFHWQKKAKVTITLCRVPDPLEYGVIITNDEGYITQFLEKPTWGEVISDTVNTGIYVIEPEVLDLVPSDQPYDFSKQLFPKLLAKDMPMAGYVAEGYWCDIGNVSSLRQATFDVLEGKVNGISLGKHIGGNIWTGDDVEIAPTATLLGPIYLGNSVKVRNGAVIRGPTVIRDYSIIEERSQIDRSIVWRNCYVGKGVELRGAMILRHCSLKSKSVIYEGAVVGDGSIIGEGAVIHPNVKIWSGKEIEPGATIKNSVIWGSQGRRVLFGRYGVTGMINVDFTPEFSAKLGAAFGATLPKGSIVTFNRDPHRSPRMLKRGAIAGLPSAGIEVADMGVQPIPVARYFTRVSDAVGGIHIRLSPFDQMVVNTRFMDANGMNISKDAERKIERVFFREDFRRVYMNEIGVINYAARVREAYTRGFLSAINVTAIRDAKFNLVIDYASAPTANILPGILNLLECNVVALNANIDETKMSIPYEMFKDALRRLRVISQSLQANLGVRMDVGGETIFIVDNSGRSLSGIDLCAAMTELVLTAKPGRTVAISVNLPHIFEYIAARHDGKIIRTGVDTNNLMQASLVSDVVMAGDGKGNFIFPEFQPCVDGLMALAKLLEFLATQQRQLADVVIDLPTYYLSQAKVYCLWEAKGSVMRQLNQRFQNRLVNTIEGIKIVFSEREWVLILPSQDQPHIEVIAEAESQEGADERVEEYTQLIRTLQPRSM